MKTKIFALILALCCLSVLLVACKDDPCVTHVDEDGDLVCDTCGSAVAPVATQPETEADTTEPATESVTEPETEAATETETETEKPVPTCKEHVDAEPADEVCDVCGRAMVVIYQPVEPETETRVQMETVAIPGDFNIKDFIELEDMNKPFDSMDTEDDDIDYDMNLGNDVVLDIEELTETEIVTIVPEEPVDPDAETETETEVETEVITNVVGTRYDFINLLTGEKIMDSIVVGAPELPDGYDVEVSGGMDIENDATYPFNIVGNTISATNVPADEDDGSFHNTVSTFTMNIREDGDLYLTFDVHSEEGYDDLIVSKNGSIQFTISGEDLAGSETVAVSAGDVVTIRYSKDSSQNRNGERCRVTIDASFSLDGVFSGNTAIPGVHVIAYDYYFIVNKTIYTAETTGEGTEEETTTYSVAIERAAYTYSGQLIAKATWNGVYEEALGLFVREDGKTIEDEWKFESVDENSAYVKFVYDGTAYVIDKATHEVRNGGNVNTFVDRPDFDYENDEFGFVWDGTSIYAYDLSAWVDCVYTYDVPSYFEYYELVALQGGKFLVQGSVCLPDDAVSYDYIEYDYEYGYKYCKYDLCYVLIDPAQKTATEIGFGYYVYCEESSYIFSEDAPTVLRVYPIENDRINYAKALYLAVDADMKVLGQVADLFFWGEEMYALGTEYLYQWDYLLNCYKVLDLNGQLVTYLGSNTDIIDNTGRLQIAGDYYMLVDGKLQSLNAVLDEALVGEWTISSSYASYFVVSETIEKIVPSEEEGGEPTTEYEYNTYVVTMTAEGFKVEKVNSKTETSETTLYRVNANYYITYTESMKEAEAEEGADVEADPDAEPVMVVDPENSYFTVYNVKGEKLGDTKADGIYAGNLRYVNMYDDEIEFVYRDEESGTQYMTYYLN